MMTLYGIGISESIQKRASSRAVTQAYTHEEATHSSPLQKQEIWASHSGSFNGGMSAKQTILFKVL
jgi:hypothetical protein